jgi:hypothetical protein
MATAIDRATERLGTAAADAAMRAAVEYLRTRGLEVNTDRLVDALRAHVKARLPEALRDAREALACRMTGAATATFLASMQLAGIDAAKEVTRTAA